MKKVLTFTEEGVLKTCQKCGKTVLIKANVTECPNCEGGTLVVDDSVFECGRASRMLLMKSDEYDPDKMPFSLRNEESCAVGHVPAASFEKSMSEVASVDVHMFVESGVLKICKDCGETMLVGENVHRCPLCGSENLETDDSMFEGGYASRSALANDWMYNPSPCPVVNMSIPFKPTEKTPDPAKPLAPIISMNKR